MHQKYDVDPQGEIKFQMSDTDGRIILKITKPHVSSYLPHRTHNELAGIMLTYLFAVMSEFVGALFHHKLT